MAYYILFPFFAATIASPAVDNLAERGASPPSFCSAVTKLVSAAGQQSAATAFCSSYLSIPVSTTTQNVPGPTPTTTTTTTITSTVATNTVEAASCASPTPSAKKKRSHGQPKPKPPCLSKYTISSVVSSACSCLSVPTSTTTTTVTGAPGQTVTSTATSTSSVTATRTTLAEPSCTNEVATDFGGASYNLYYAGCGYQRSGGTLLLQYIGIYTDPSDPCGAAGGCADECGATGGCVSYAVYYTFSGGYWKCTVYFGYSNPSFNEQNSDVIAYGYD